MSRLNTISRLYYYYKYNFYNTYKSQLSKEKGEPSGARTQTTYFTAKQNRLTLTAVAICMNFYVFPTGPVRAYYLPTSWTDRHHLFGSKPGPSVLPTSFVALATRHSNRFFAWSIPSFAFSPPWFTRPVHTVSTSSLTMEVETLTHARG